MASIRIHFPDQEQPRSITLKGARITVGRAPNNTIQIIDRMVSAHHAEFVEDDGHYRLHDLGSTNGVFVNGQQVTDYHLRESCKIGFGTLECEFSAEAATEAGAAEELATRAEVKALAEEKETLQAKVASLEQALDVLSKAKPVEGEDVTLFVPKAEFENVVNERNMLKDMDQKRAEEVARLQADLLLLRRDRENLQRALDSARADLDTIRKQIAPDVKSPAPEQAALPKDLPAASPETVQAIPAPKPAAAAPKQETGSSSWGGPKPTPKPPQGIPKPAGMPKPSVPAAAAAPSAQGPAAVPRAVPGGVPTARPMGSGQGSPGVPRQPVAVPRAQGIPRAAAAPKKAGDTQKLDA